ncbi:hypothetical protein [Flavobacterium sp. 11]|uniref:hypothetical protein n=1 Tax=Flavobacterium sp. 11 TaxID=357523 RepID=UPI000C1A435F|nr:hypothetical protein [Flavobacterium sp. 11]PIF62663.1 hypothetical protein CLV00_2315 [Flavobacterium sp. 11]
MKSLLVGTILLFSIISFGQNLNDLDAKNGFRNDIFGTPVESFSTLAVLEKSKDGYNVYYKKTDENFSLGDVEISDVYYSFYKGKLESISFSTKGYANSKGILDILKSNYGSGYQSNKYMEKYYWLGKTIVLSYTENSTSRDAKVYISTNVNKAEQEKDKKESIAKVKI